MYSKECMTGYRTPDEILTPSHTALVVIDMQRDFCDDDGKYAQAGRDNSPAKLIIPKCQKLLETARKQNIFVVHIQQVTLPGQQSDGISWLTFKTRDGKSSEYALLNSSGAQHIPELAPLEQEPVIQKFRPSAFHGTFLDQILRANRVESVLFCGCTTEGCVLATVLDASFHDYYTCVVEDAVATSVPGMQEAAIAFMRTRYKLFTTQQIVNLWSSGN